MWFEFKVNRLPEEPQLCQQGGVLLDLVRWRLGRLLVLKPQTLNFLQDFSAKANMVMASLSKALKHLFLRAVNKLWTKVHPDDIMRKRCCDLFTVYLNILESIIEVNLYNVKKNLLISKVHFLQCRWNTDATERGCEERHSSLTCFCSQARQWAASAACWHPDSTAALRGPSAVEPVGESVMRCHTDDIIQRLYLTGAVFSDPITP